MPDTSDRLSASPCARSPRSVRSGAFAVALTGMLVVAIPFGLLLGKDGLVTVGVNRDAALPTPHLIACDSTKPVRSHRLAEGQCVRVVGSGFDPNELIEVADSRDASWRTYVRADGAGRFTLRHVAHNAPTTELLSFTGTHQATGTDLPRVVYCRLTSTPNN